LPPVKVRRRARAHARPHLNRSVVVTQLVNKVLLRGQRSTSEHIVYKALDEISRKTGGDPVTVLKRAVENVRPQLEVKSRRVGGATYQVPVEVRPGGPPRWRSAGSWATPVSAARRRWAERLSPSSSMPATASGRRSSVREDLQKMAESNKAFAHYRLVTAGGGTDQSTHPATAG